VVVAVLSMVGAACGGSEGGAPTLAAPACAAGQIDGDLVLYNWPNYLPTETDARALGIEDIIGSFEAEYGVQGPGGHLRVQ